MTGARSLPMFAQSFDTPLSIFMLSLRTLLRTLSLRTKKACFGAQYGAQFCCGVVFCSLTRKLVKTLHTRGHEILEV